MMLQSTSGEELSVLSPMRMIKVSVLDRALKEDREEMIYVR